MDQSRKNKLRQKDKFKKSTKRKTFHRIRKSGFYKFYFDVVEVAKRKGRKLTKEELPKFEVYSGFKPIPNSTIYPPHTENIRYFSDQADSFSSVIPEIPSDGLFKVPDPFSLTSSPEKSLSFLRSLYETLYNDKIKNILIDYEECKRIDLDASVCMDVMLADFIEFYNKCKAKRISMKMKMIMPINYQKEAIKKILFSIGAFKNIAGVEIKYDNIIPFPLIIGDNKSSKRAADKEREVTQMVDYIEARLAEMNHELTWQAADRLSKVIGEVLINAAEHSGCRYRYAIGYFEKQKGQDAHVGIFNLTILSFGKTIYQNFKENDEVDINVITRMKELSDKYTTRGIFKPREFEEETLWTLYALQQGVTSIRDKKRGNGSINFIESFFSLKGDMNHDNLSSLTIISGHTRIKFDGTYQIVERKRGTAQNVYKMMTFNTTGEIEEKPDDKFVSFAENFFPGTLITAKICINFNNLEQE